MPDQPEAVEGTAAAAAAGAAGGVSASLPGLRLRGWRDPQVVGLALLAMSAGFGQFGVVAALGDVARTFGHLQSGASLADQAGLSGTKLGIGLAIIRLASLGGLPAAGLADRLGRRRTLIIFCAVGLAITVASAASPGYWWFVVIFALGRPMLSATNALAGVSAAEETSTHDRAKAIALIAAGYGIGTGLVAFLHGLVGGQLGFRGLVALAVVPLVLMPFVARRVEEPDRFARQTVAPEHRLPVLSAVAPQFRRRLVTVSVIAFALSAVTGPVNSFVYLYAENVVHVKGYVTSAMVAAAGVTGLCGLLLGRYTADRFGRRPTIAIAMTAIAGLGVLTYSGSTAGVLIGYVLGVLAASTIAPAAGSFVNELFPTSVRASVAGWQVAVGVLGASAGLLAFGAIADVGNRFGVAAVATFLPPLAALVLLAFLPETRDRELEDSWPDPRRQVTSRGARSSSGTRSRYSGCSTMKSATNGHTGTAVSPRRADVVEGCPDEAPGETLSLQGGVDLGMGEPQASVDRAVLGDTGELRAGVDLVAVAVRVVHHGRITRRIAVHRVLHVTSSCQSAHPHVLYHAGGSLGPATGAGSRGGTT